MLTHTSMCAPLLQVHDQMAPQAANRLREVHKRERGNATARAKRYRGSLKDQHKQLAAEKGRAWQEQQSSKVQALQDQHRLSVSNIGQGQLAAQEFNEQRDRELQDAEARRPQQLLDEAARFAAALHSLHATRGEGQRRIQVGQYILFPFFDGRFCCDMRYLG